MTRIVKLAARGDGVDEAGGYHAGTAPGDMIAPDGSIMPGPHRAEPACRHYGVCGGCQLQHVDDAAFADFLVERISSALAAQGLGAPAIRQPLLSPPRSRRRVSMKALRLGKRVVLGFSAEKSHKLVDLAECATMRDELFALMGPLRHLLPTIIPDKQQAEVRMTLSDRGVDLMLSGVEVDGLEATERLTAFAQRHGIARLSVDEGYGATARWEPEPVTVTLGGVAVALPDTAFLQATADGEAALITAVQEAVAGAETVADLFAGLGTFALSVPATTLAVEGARNAILSLQQAANAAQRGIVCDHRDLFRRPLTPAELSGLGAVILDPPRAGAKEQVEHLAASDVPVIAYVSCNPSTFARDAKLLADGGYVLEWIQPVGQFRWSTHVELAARFSR